MGEPTSNVPGFHPMKAVYTYLFPETRAVLSEIAALTRQPELFRVTADATSAGELLTPLVTPPLAVTATPEGKLDLDMIHVPVIDRVIAAYAKAIPGLAGFANRYPGHGSSDGLFHLLVKLRISGVTNINVLDGEYEGYGAQAANLGMTCTEHKLDDPNAIKQAPGYWFISNPSARNGNVVPAKFIKDLCDNGHKVILDLAYVGLTAAQPFDVSHPNIVAIVMSFSKPFGVFRFRLGGFTFSREAVPSLYGTKWFKDCERVLQALALAERIGPECLYNKYRPIQERIIADLNTKFGLGLIASDVVLLAHLPESQAASLDEPKRAMIAPFKRGGYYRFCLTPYLEQYELAESQK